MIALTGGGTGGHLAVVAAVKEALNDMGIKPLYIGSTAGQDQAWFSEATGFSDVVFLKSRSVVNRNFIFKFFALINILRRSREAKKILQAHKVKAVLSVGGYSAAPAAFAAVRLKLPLVIHEQNAHAGALNSLLAPFAKAVFSSFDTKSPSANYPIKSIFFEKMRIRSKVKTVIFLGGSQGARAINEYAKQTAKMLQKYDIKIIHQCGKRDLEDMLAFYAEEHIDADCFDFDPNLADRLANADLAVARAGAGTMFELAANALPALFVPYPHAAGNHQMANAKFLSEKELSWCVDQAHLTPEMLEALLGAELHEMSLLLSGLINKNGAKEIVQYLIALCKKPKVGL
ncbi:UDP-N-acetylglucosamine--N-acetylmuramyl-(pentapeptide) pyrophosphoryl-undecaprenol N-acetylglucosamine transferase [Campylobacterota bacterium]|nr:UDP-N-acetylglucosamine--N-acetylmuramyl-(pentapeptide) pyrophosphoryl-undecaprenol N-acetylglucosamine transferase [Campylobacterota bacterium]